MRLLIVSNRLAVTATKTATGKLEFVASAGGLVSGLSAYLDSLRDPSVLETHHLWIGWPGMAVSKKAQPGIRDTLLHNSSAYPVFIPQKTMDRFYFGFCNRTIWPLFHYFPAYTTYSDAEWTQYRQVNEMFADAVSDVAEPDDVIWVHDYHLMLLPRMLRERMPNAAIGFFLHIPFPHYEVFRLIPTDWRGEIVRGLLGADLVGFHTAEYTEHFRECVSHQRSPDALDANGQGEEAPSRVETFPMGIDYERYERAAHRSAASGTRAQIKQTLGPHKVILSVDRLDYTKGIINRLHCYETFLQTYPEWRRKVVLALIVVPSRVGVDDYQRTKRQIDEMVGNINGTYGSLDWTPILYQYRFLPLDDLAAIYNLSDVALVTPLRDGMNLIAKEYVAARTDRTGVLVLSDMAGAAKELTDAVLVNPNDIKGMARALKEALEMPLAEQQRRMGHMQAHLAQHTVSWWAERFLGSLLKDR